MNIAAMRTPGEIPTANEALQSSPAFPMRKAKLNPKMEPKL